MKAKDFMTTNVITCTEDQSVADAANGLNIDFSGANTGTGLITVADNLAAALTVKEGSNEIVKVVSTNSSEEIVLGYKLDLGDNDIENVGTISADKIQVDAAGTGLEIDFNGNTELNKIQLTDNLADALNIAEGSNSYMKFVTTNSSELVQFSKDVEFGGDTATFTSANANDPLVVIKNTANDADGARLQFVKDKGAAGADGARLGKERRPHEVDRPRPCSGDRPEDGGGRARRSRGSCRRLGSQRPWLPDLARQCH